MSFNDEGMRQAARDYHRDRLSVSANGTKPPWNDPVAVDSDLISMNEKYAVVRIGGKTRVVTMEDSPAYPGSKVPVFSTIPDFNAFHAKQKKEIIGPDGNKKRIGIGKWWIDHDQRRQYDGITYAPNVDIAGKLNLWTGYGCEPVKDNCDLYLAHLHDNICGKNPEYSKYLLGWMAYAVQHPGRQGEVAVVLRGKEGVGKGVFAKEFGRLFGSHFKQILNAKHLVGHFNAHLQHCSVLFADEAFFAGDRSHESVLKGLITEETLLVEPKGVDPYSVRNCIHLIMSSNSEWVVPAGADARRYFVLDVSAAHMQDHRYFGAIAGQMDNGGRAALLEYLLRVPIKDFDVRAVPQTEALADQKTRSRRGVDRLVEMVAHSGILPATDPVHANVAITTGEEKGEGFYCGARSMVPELRHDGSIVVAKTLKEGWGCKSWKSGYRRGIEFPPLPELRAMFDRKHGRQEWQVDITDWEGAS
jgi:Mesyanzhinovviridae DNA primase